MGKEFWESADLVGDISDELLEEMASQIKPLILREDGYWAIKPPRDNRMVSFLWDAEPTEKVGAFSPLKSFEIMTFHRFGAPVFFKPSIAEVMSAINRFVPDWSAVRWFSLQSDAMGPEHVIGHCHWCRCKLFTGGPTV